MRRFRFARRLSKPMALAVAFAVATIVLAGCSSSTVESPPTVEPTATATETATGTAVPSPTVAASSTPTGPPEDLAAIEARVEELRGLTPATDLQREFVDDSGLHAILDDELSDPDVRDSFIEEGRLLIALGLLPADTDIIELYGALLDEQVLGLYDPATRSMYVRGGAPFDTLQEVTYAHEYVHALQDAHFDLEALDSATPNRDASYALSALVEGDATLWQTLYLQELGLSAALQLLGASLSAPTPDVPPVLLDFLVFPYQEGLTYATALNRAGGSPAIDRAFETPPASTEQVLHPEKYETGEPPLEIIVPFEALADRTVEYDDVLGELTLRLWLRRSGVSSRVASAAAAGWGGDRFALLERAEGASDFVAVIDWDTEGDAAEFAQAVLGSPLDAGSTANATLDDRAVALARPAATRTVLAVSGSTSDAEALVRDLTAIVAS